VVEATEHQIELGLAPRDATIKAMSQVSGPVIAVGLVLSAVFVPCAFISGITGQFFRQFALTIATSTVISAFNSLTLSPALASILLRSRDKETHEPLPRLAISALLGWLGYQLLTSGVKHTLNIAGNSFLLSAYGSNFGSFFCILDDFANRLTPELYSEEIAARLRQRFAAEVPEATVSVFGAPPVRGVGRSGGFKIMIEDRGDLGLQNLQEQAENLMRKGNQLRRFKLTDETLAALGEDGVPAEVVEALASLQDQPLDTEMSFPDALDKLLTAEQLQQHKANLLRLVKISGYQLAAENLTTLRRQGVVDQIQLTANGLATLRKQGVPDEVVAAWKLLQDQVYPSEMNLRQALAERLPEAVTAELWKRYQDLTVHAALRKPGDTDRYQLAEGTFVALHKQKVPDEIVAAWKRLQGKEYPSEESLREALARVSKSAVAGLLRRYQALAVDAAEVAIIEALKTLRDKPYRSEARWRAALAEHLSAEQRDRFADAIVDAAKQEVPAPLVGLFNVFRANSPQLYADVDRTQCMKMGVLLPEAFGTLQTYLGSLHVNDFNRFGRTWQVNVQADARFRNQVEAVSQLKVRNNRGQMVPLGAVATLRQISGPFILTRYNMYPAAGIAGNAATGVSSGDAIALMERLARHELPPSMTFEWTEMAFLELQAGNTAMIIFAFAVVGLHPDADGLHPHAGQGLLAGQRATARRRLRGAHPAGHGPDRGDPDRHAGARSRRAGLQARDAGGQAHGGHCGPIPAPECERPQLWVGLRDAGRFPAPHGSSAVQRGDQETAAAAVPRGDLGRDDQPVRRPAGRWPGHRRRFQDHARGPRRQWAGSPAGRRRQDRRRGERNG
jgi:AcrB/AcrD/AcrF family